MNNWQLPATTYQRIEQMINGGILTLKASRDLTCELPIIIIIDATDQELFISVTIQNFRKFRTFTINDSNTKNLLINKLIDFINSCIDEAIAQEAL